ncbi:MAG: citrate/2-methylcitrate synthase [Myxococcota bacterium]
MATSAVLTVGNDSYELPIVMGSDGARAIDIRTLHAQSGLTTLDEGLGSTAVCRSAITSLDAAQGRLHYRGYDVEELAARVGFLDVAHLLVWGELPTAVTRTSWLDEVAAEAPLPQEMSRWFATLPPHADPMAVMSAAVAILGGYYGPSVDLYDAEAVHAAVRRILGKLPTLAAAIVQRTDDGPWPIPNTKRDYIGRLLDTLFEDDAQLLVPREMAERALDVALLLQADHEQNTSTTAARIVGSTYASPYAVVAAGIGALSGPRHGGAGQAVASMLRQIVEDGGDVRGFVERVKHKQEGALLMGFGHRVYAARDPRAEVLAPHATRLLASLRAADPWLDVAQKLESLSREDDYFAERQLAPNFDFYACVIYRALALPVRMFPVLFALGRAAGWLAQWHEMMQDRPRIVRPRQLYIGKGTRTVTS